ncbi:hypothetical protein [Dysgonomonas sp. 511]|uniref:hypothetical protein n=1 Tax=Dysgonomonas sp. 511 TaxID=2302930 RepID=UPI0013D2B863|nr:hypothetical protein [Dysgonomonas sp. 511]NDV77873.1 hypothetical protein [Dysgonomonas sp. 511]
MATININARIDVDDVLNELTDKQLIDEVKEREIEDQLDIDPDDIEMTNEDVIDYLSQLPSYKLKDLFCDMAGVNHHTPKDELMKLLSEKI